MKNKKLLGLLPVFFALIGVLSLRFLTPEDSWICKNGNWIKHGNPSGLAPTTGCGKQEVVSENKATPSDSSKSQNTVTVYFSNSIKAGTGTDCKLVYGVERTVDSSSSNYEAALKQLFQGPTDAEKSEGYTSFFSSQTKNILKSVKVIKDTAYVNLSDIRTLIPNASTSCGSAQLLSSIENTLKHDSEIKTVRFAIEGSPESFYDWIQIGCDKKINNCDPKPFVN